MNVAIYVPWIYQKGGIERVLIEYTKKTKHKLTFLTNHYSPKTTFPEFKKMNIIELEKVPINRNYFDLARVSLKIMKQKLSLEKFDALLIVSSGFGEFVAINNHNIPTICYCCTPLKVIHDEKTKEEYLGGNVAKTAIFSFFKKVYRKFEKKAWKNIKYTIAISEETKRRIIKARLKKENEIQVITPGINCSKIKAVNTYKKYFLVPGRFIWHKNFELAIEAFREFSKTNKKFELIVAGGLDKKNQTYFNKLKELSKGLKVKFVISPSDRELFKLYKESYCVLFTAINEDFGIVPVEAMAYGKAVISVNEGGPKETIINEKTGYLVERNEKEFSQKMLLLAKNLKLNKKLGNNGKKHAKEFDWKVIASNIDKVITKSKQGE
ncbi:MAG TPA: glycosyltransferase [archaeon]|nr:glycosyltransferase [archaeon]